MSIAADLQVYLMEARSRPFDYRTHDCSTLAADWIVSRGHDDPMRRWRGRYANESAANALIDEHSLEGMWTLGMIDAGIPEADEPMIGDVGLVECVTDSGAGLVGAIYGGKRWSALGDKGLFQASMQPVKIWRVHDRLREVCQGG